MEKRKKKKKAQIIDIAPFIKKRIEKEKREMHQALRNFFADA